MGRVGDRVAVRVAKPLRKPQHHLRHVREGGRIHATGWRRREQRLRLMIESLVAVLLLLTIVYCVVLNSRLKRLKADEQALKGDDRAN